MKNIMITATAMALAFSIPTLTGAEAPSKSNTASFNTDNSTKTGDITKKSVDVTKTNIDVTKTIDSHKEKTTDSYNEKTKTNTNSGDSKASGAFAPSANNSSTATSSLKLDLTNAFNKTTVVNATKLEGTVSNVKIHDIGNTGGYASNDGNAGRGGTGGDAKAIAYSGKAVANGGDGGDSKAGHGNEGGKSVTALSGDGGSARNSEKGHDKTNQTAKAGDGGSAKGAAGGSGGAGGAGGTGGAGGAGGTATSGDATAKAIGGDGGVGGALSLKGGSAGTFNASNTLSDSFSHAAGINFAIQNTGMASLQQVGVTTMATIGK